MLGNDERGLLFQSGNADDLAEKLAFLITNDQLRHKLATRAADFSRTKLNIEIAAMRMAEIYEKMLQGKAES